MNDIVEEIDPTSEKIYTVREVAQMFDVTDWSIRMWMKQGKLKGQKIGGRLYFTDKAIRDYANNRWG